MTKPLSQILLDSWNGISPEGVGSASTLSKEEYLEHLAEGVWVVEFTKVDGTDTKMEVTLDENIKPAPLKESTQQRAEQPHLIHAYSLDRQGWRSFTIANVKAFYRKP